MKSKNLIDAFIWAFNQIENRALTTVQQNALLHIINRLNRNMWNPVPLIPKALAASMSVDQRTASKAIEYLVKSGLVIETEGGYDIAEVTRTARSTAALRPARTRRNSNASTDISEEAEPQATAGLRIFTVSNSGQADNVNEPVYQT